VDNSNHLLRSSTKFVVYESRTPILNEALFRNKFDEELDFSEKVNQIPNEVLFRFFTQVDRTEFFRLAEDKDILINYLKTASQAK